MLVLLFSVGFASDPSDPSDPVGSGPWVELTGFVDDVHDAVVVVQGIEVDISQADMDIWQPLEAGFLVEVEGWLDTSTTPFVLIAREFSLEGIGYDYQHGEENEGQGNRGGRGQHGNDWDDD